MAIEALVTVPLEAALTGIPGLATVRSKSVLGLSSVVLILEPGTDVMSARQIVQERVSRAASQLPAIARPPVMLSPLSSLSRVMKIGVSSGRLSQIELTTLAKWTMRPRMMAVSGVANVAIWGQRDRQLQVLVDPDRLRAHAVSLDEVVQSRRRRRFPAARGVPGHAEPASLDHPFRHGAVDPRSRIDRGGIVATALSFGLAMSRLLWKGHRRPSATR